MNSDIVNPFVEATLDVMKNMAQLDATLGKASLKQSEIAQASTSGFIELIGSTPGTLSISFCDKAIMRIYENMLGDILESIDHSALDLVGEFTNMVCGGAKQRLSQKGYDFSLSQPKILSGKDHAIEHIRGCPVLTLPLEMSPGNIFIEVGMSR